MSYENRIRTITSPGVLNALAPEHVPPRYPGNECSDTDFWDRRVEDQKEYACLRCQLLDAREGLNNCHPPEALCFEVCLTSEEAANEDLVSERDQARRMAEEACRIAVAEDRGDAEEMCPPLQLSTLDHDEL